MIVKFMSAYSKGKYFKKLIGIYDSCNNRNK